VVPLRDEDRLAERGDQGAVEGLDVGRRHGAEHDRRLRGEHVGGALERREDDPQDRHAVHEREQALDGDGDGAVGLLHDSDSSRRMLRA